jgi:formate-dependent nitrite reductase membrane component NrfD
MVPDATPTSYYGHPILKAPVWKWPIPTYLFTGGLAAGTALVGAGAHAGGNRLLARRASLGTLGAVAVSGGLLVKDLGRPSRFHHMLRVVKPTSPMSVGTWIFSAFSAAAGATAGAELLAGRGKRSRRGARALGGAGLGRPAGRGLWPALAGAGHLATAGLAPALATYTGVLLADTAVPAWHGARHELPFVFAGGAAASGGALGVLLAGGGPGPSERGARPRRLAVAGSILEVGAGQVMRRRLGELGEPYHQGVAAILSRGSHVATLVGGAALAGAGAFGAGVFGAGTTGRGARRLDVAGSAFILAGAALERFAVFHAGRQSASDPKYVVGPQRRRLVPSAAPA